MVCYEISITKLDKPKPIDDLFKHERNDKDVLFKERKMAKKKRSNGYYSTTVSIRNQEGGTTRKTIYAKTVKELENKKAEYRQQCYRGIVTSNQTTFAELADIWIDMYKANSTQKNTLRYMRNSVQKHLISKIGNSKVTNLIELDLQHIITEMARKGYARDTVAHVRNYAIHIMDTALGNRIIDRNVFSYTKLPKDMPTYEREPIDLSRVQLITKTYRKHRMGIGALIMLYTGIRRGELIPLRWDDIYFKQKTMRINKAIAFLENGNQPVEKKPKSKSGKRTIVIPDILLEALMEHYAAAGQKSEFVCAGIDQGILTQTKFRCAWKSYLSMLNQEAGGHNGTNKKARLQVIDNFSAHQLRHTYITELQRKEIPMWGIKILAGHSMKKDITFNYTHASLSDLQRFIDRAFNACGGFGNYSEQK